MALNCSITIPGTSIVLTYWNIHSFTFNAPKNTFDLVLAGFISKDERDAGNVPLKMWNFHWKGAENPVTPTVLQTGGAYAAVYAKVKEAVPSTIFSPNQPEQETNPFVNATDAL